MKNLAVLFILLVVITPYAMAKENYVTREIVESWTGESLDRIIEVWSYPDKEQIIANRRLLYWLDESKEYAPDLFGHIAEYTLNCNRIIETDEKNNIVNIKIVGNYCPVAYADGRYKGWVNPEKSYYKYKKEAQEKKRLEKMQKKLEKSKNKN